MGWLPDHRREQRPTAQHEHLHAAGTGEAVKAALTTLQQQFFPEVVRNTQLFTELFERSARPALIRVRSSYLLACCAAFLLTCHHQKGHGRLLPAICCRYVERCSPTCKASSGTCWQRQLNRRRKQQVG